MPGFGELYKEKCSSDLVRVIDLPMDVDVARAKATLKDGVLELDLPG